jgi:PAS domain S-box-containing protein
MSMDRHYVTILVLLLSAGILIVLGVTTASLHSITVTVMRDRLLDSVVTFGRYLSEEQSLGEDEEHVLRRFRLMHEQLPYVSPSFEVVLGRREDDLIAFLLEQRFGDKASGQDGKRLGTVPLDSTDAEPMRRALRGETGTVVGPDYRGETVIAAYTTVPGPGWGLVFKVDQSEFQERYFRATAMAAAAAVVVIIIATLIARAATRPLRRRVASMNRQMQDILHAVGAGVIVTDPKGTVRHFNPAAEKIFGYGATRIIGRNVSMLMPRAIASPHDTHLQEGMTDLGSSTIGILHQVRGLHRLGQEIPIGLFVTDASVGGERLLVSSVLDLTDLVHAQADLADRERQMATLMGNLPGMAYRCLDDADWTMLFVSGGCLELTGYKPAELIGNSKKSYGDIIHPADQGMVFEAVSAAVRNDEPFHLTYRIHRKDGEVRWVNERGVAILQDGASHVLEGFVMDVTRDRDAHDQLRTSEERFRLIVEGRSTLFGTYVIAYDDDGLPRFTYVSPKFCDIFQNPAEHFVGRLSVDLVHPKDRPRMANRLEAKPSLSEGNDHFEFTALRGDGSEIIVEVFSGVAELQGRPVALGVVLDITARRDAEQMDAYLRNLNEILPTPICARRADGRILFANRAFADTWCPGQKTRLFTAAATPDFPVPPAVMAAFQQGDDQVLATDDVVETAERRIPSIAGTERIFHTYRRKLSFQSEAAVLEVMLDITDHLRAEADRLEAKIAAEAAEEARVLTESFLASVTHETRTPVHQTMAFIALAIKAIRRQSMDLALDHLGEAEAAAVRMQNLIDDLLDLAKIRAGQMEFEVRVIDVVELAERALSHEHPRALEKDISLSFAGPKDREVRVRGDLRRLRQVFANLLSNAVKFTDIGGVTVEVQERDGRCRVLVADTGPGVPEADRQNIFEPFFQSDAGRSKVGSTGLGLAICREIVSSHGGRIWVDDHPDGGAVFVVDLPLAEADL